MVIYFSKINLNSVEIFDVYKDKELLREILSIVLGDMKSGVYYEDHQNYRDEDGNLAVDNIRYNLAIRNKTDEIIDGVLYKKSKVFYKKFDPNRKELVQHWINNVEGIRFYFDVFRETVGFYTSNRFGYKEFNSAFSGILNRCMEINKRNFRFDVGLRTEGLQIEEIIEQLNKIDRIKELKIKFQPPNPDEKMLEEIKKSGESVVEHMEDANVTGMSYVFSSKSVTGLNLNSKIIKDNLNNVKNLSYIVDDKKAIGKGYIAVEAIGGNGKKYTTADQKPVKTVIDRAEEFVEACKNVIGTFI